MTWNICNPCGRIKKSFEDSRQTLTTDAFPAVLSLSRSSVALTSTEQGKLFSLQTLHHSDTNNARHDSQGRGVPLKLHTKLFFQNASKHQTPIRYEFHSPYQDILEWSDPISSRKWKLTLLILLLLTEKVWVTWEAHLTYLFLKSSHNFLLFGEPN